MWTVLGGMAGVASLVWAVAFVGSDKDSSSSGGNASPSVDVRVSAGDPGVATTGPDDPTPSAETSVASVPTASVGPETPIGVGDPAAAGPVWMAQLASVAIGDTARLNTVVSKIRQDVPEAQVLTSAAFASLRPGYWVVYATGGFATGWDALEFCAAHGRPAANACFGRLLSHDVADLPFQCYPGAAASAARCEKN